MNNTLRDTWGLRASLAIAAIALSTLFFVGLASRVSADKVVTQPTTAEVVVEESAPAPAVVVQQAEITSDKADYAPTDTVTIFGRLFEAFKSVVLTIAGGVGDTYREFVQYVTTDANGEFTAQQELDGVFRPEYNATATDENGNVLAQTSFTDAAIGTYDQCSNDDGDGYVGSDTGCQWINGNINGGNSTYQEGDSTVQRLWVDGFLPGSNHSITFQYGTTKQGKHAYDFLTSWNHSENWITDTDRCQDITGCIGATDNVFAIPNDPNQSGQFQGTVGARNFVIRGGTITAASTPSLSGSYTGDSETSITVSFTVGAANGSMCTTKGQTTTCGIAIWFGAHIARSADWEPFNNTTGATSISGSPYHVALLALDGGSVGSRDNQMQASAIPETGNIIVDKVTLPGGDTQSFNFTAGGTGYSNFSLTDAATPNNQELEAGTYSISETVPAGWTQTSAICISSIGDQETIGNLELDASETITCTFTNTKKGRIIVDKVTNPAGDSQSFAFTTTGTGYNGFNLTDAAAPNNQEVVPGKYSVAETPIAGWDLTNTTCTSDETIQDLDVEPGETVSCTFTNTKQSKVIVKKVMVGGADSFTFTGTPNGVIASDNGTIEQTVAAGQYVATETPVAGWDLTSVVCSDNDSVGSVANSNATFNVAAGETVTCTFTNTKRGKILVKKETLPDGSQQSFGFTASYNGNGFNLSDGGINDSGLLIPGTYSVSENATTGWDLTSATCDDQSAPGSISLQAGETVTCTFTNTQKGKVIVKKTMVGGTGSFTFTGTPNGVIASNNGTIEQMVTPGQYVSTETPLAGWDLTSVVCDDANSVGSVTNSNATFNIAPGETVTCTFTNTKRGSITIEKQTLPDGDAATFAFTGEIATSLSDGGTSTKEVVPGNYAVTEGTKTDWTLTNITCSDSDSTGNTTTRVASFVVAAGENVTCVFTNTYTPPLVVTKTAETTFTRTYNWTIDKSVTPSTWDLFEGDSGTSEYTVAVDKTGSTDSNWNVSGTITIKNNAAVAAEIIDVTDSISNQGAAVVVCPGGLAQSLPAGATLVCTYSKALTDGDAETNTATVTTSGIVAGGQGTANVAFDTPTTIVNATINVTDDKQGTLGSASDDKTFTYTKTFTCDTNDGVFENTAKIVETNQSDKVSVTVNCHDLTVTKTAATAYTKTWTWTIDKTSATTNLTLAPGATYPVDYTVTVNATSVNSNHAVSGTIQVQNNNPIPAKLNSVTDVMGAINGTVDCGETFPYTLAANASLNCTYMASVPNGDALTNTATATLQNHSYDKALAATPGGTKDYSGTASVNFANATVTEVDECINVTDDKKGALGAACANEVPKQFKYTMNVGPYTDADCGMQKTFDNTATLTTNDTGTTGSNGHTVTTQVACTCTLTQGYWKTHNASFRGGAPIDDSWNLLTGGLKEQTGFFTTANSFPVVGPNPVSMTWFSVFWTAPQGNVYYNLAHQYMAAKLNRLSGAQSTPAVESAIAQAEALFVAKKPSDTIKLKGNEKNLWTNLAGTLASYNEGKIGPGHCSEVIIP